MNLSMYNARYLLSLRTLGRNLAFHSKLENSGSKLLSLLEH